MQIILEWSTSEEELAFCMEFPDHLRKLAIFILDLVSLIDDDIMPLDLLQTVQADPHTLKTGHQHIEFPLINNCT